MAGDPISSRLSRKPQFVRHGSVLARQACEVRPSTSRAGVWSSFETIAARVDEKPQRRCAAGSYRPRSDDVTGR